MKVLYWLILLVLTFVTFQVACVPLHFKAQGVEFETPQPAPRPTENPNAR